MKYEVAATVDRIIDGDSIEVTLSLGWSMYHKTSIRLHHVDTPEMRGGTDISKAAARLAKAHVETLVPIGSKIVIDSRELDKFGRGLAIVTNSEGVDVGEDLIERALAVRYEGGNKAEVAAAHQKNYELLEAQGLISTASNNSK